MPHSKERRVFSVVTVIVSLLGLFLVLGILNNAKKSQIEQTKEMLVQEATAHFSTIKELEIWHNRFGGVFKADVNESS
ncbi:MAG: hypothetical protein JXK05_11490 [Campylobacterales bacterium]|nr:hypothetical protein [Campylobacterales bacterium]